ncbi:MAG: CPBP family intramembrane metalloprotease [Lachnospiraceae bacterium]|nr:CPBP family intramembrane metalloprotease [Lachnospiraceae bacterium]
MKKQQTTGNDKRSAVFTFIGITVMILLTLTKVVPSSTIAGYSVFVGIAFFFITEAVSKTRGSESGLRFNTIVTDFKKPGVLLWVLLPSASGIATLVVGNLIFGGEFVAHVVGRTSSILSFDKVALLIGQVIIAAFGEEIAYRGFFFGKSAKLFPIWVCAVVSSAAFAAGHIATGNTGIVAYDIATVFIDSLIFSVIYHKTGNCVISTFSHILGNAISLVAVFVFF